ncbi:MAG: Segregation and condensation protein A [Ktedonobacterales bacterium]|jgi:segregation and condensation protein A|nr:MAG: Segregation and condensation protein A [Ktedonobacterales bacterium]
MAASTDSATRHNLTNATTEDLAADLTPSPPPYTVHLPGFDGPMDLLLHLIERNQLEITAVSLVAVTDQFVQYIRRWDEPPMPRLAEFIVMAARLLLIKSRSLLPRQRSQDDADAETDPLDDAEQLRLHLLEYKMAREIARALRAREIAGLQSFARPSRLVDPDAIVAWAPPQLVGLNVQALSLVFRRVLTEKRLSEPEELPPPLVTVAQKMTEVEAILREQGRAALEDVLRSADSRFAVVVTFLAVLEMWHQARLNVVQETLFGPIEILPGPRFGEKTITSFEVPPPEEVTQPEPEPIRTTPRARRKRARSDSPTLPGFE